mmetsp:Transcript_7630/g.17842  ORF Transcript_7630/g.17842 Transcript_7630/m.17842 type:complete len:218 (-) Transcript_7630:460-1113(-)
MELDAVMRIILVSKCHTDVFIRALKRSSCCVVIFLVLAPSEWFYAATFRCIYNKRVVSDHIERPSQVFEEITSAFIVFFFDLKCNCAQLAVNRSAWRKLHIAAIDISQCLMTQADTKYGHLAIPPDQVEHNAHVRWLRRAARAGRKYDTVVMILKIDRTPSIFIFGAIMMQRCDEFIPRGVGIIHDDINSVLCHCRQVLVYVVGVRIVVVHKKDSQV